MSELFEIIPAIDIIGGKCVRLSQGDFAQTTVYDTDPVDVAKRFEAAGLTRLHLVDLDGAKAGRVTNLEVLESITAATSLVVDFSGGIKTDDELGAVLGAGAAMVGIGSVAVRQPELFRKWLEIAGPERVILGADVRDERISINGWQTETDTDVFIFLEEQVAAGLKTAYVTDISKDGMLRGPAVELYKRILERIPSLKLIASGGVSSTEDIRTLKGIGCSGAIIGKAIYEGQITPSDLVGI